MNRLLAVTVGAVIALAVATATSHGDQKPTPQKAVGVGVITHAKLAQEVFNVCDQSRQGINGATEDNCGAIQAATGFEYLCRERNASPANECWVEYHPSDTAKFE